MYTPGQGYMPDAPQALNMTQNPFNNQQQLNMMGGAGWGNLIGGMLGPNPGHEANKSLNQIPGQLQGMYQPYTDAGKSFIPGLTGQYNQLLENPGQRLNQIGESFQQSPGYQFALKQALNSVNNNAFGRGMGGSPEHEQLLMQKARDISNQDYYNYLGHAEGLYGQGLQGAGNMVNTGMQGTNQLAQSIMDTLMDKAGLGYGSAMNKSQNLGGSLGAIGGSLGGTLGSGGSSGTGNTVGSVLGTGAGAFFGGPGGAAIGGKLGGWLGGMFD